MRTSVLAKQDKRKKGEKNKHHKEFTSSSSFVELLGGRAQFFTTFARAKLSPTLPITRQEKHWLN